MAQTLTCPLCGSPAAILARPEPWTFARCSACGTYFVDPMPAGDAVEHADEVYTEAYYGGSARTDEHEWEQATRESSDARVRDVEHTIGRKGRWLDVGCGTGYLLAAAKARGWDVLGVEVSARAADYARTVHGVDVVAGTLAGARVPDGSFDAVSLVHVLEHVPDPQALLADCRRALAGDGLLALAIPNPRALLYTAYNAYHLLRRQLGKTRFSCSLYPPSHLYAWDAPAVRRLLTRAGFDVTSVVVTGKGDPQRYPVVSWGTGAVAQTKRAAETLGRRIGRGSLIEVRARPAPVNG